MSLSIVTEHRRIQWSNDIRCEPIPDPEQLKNLAYGLRELAKEYLADSTRPYLKIALSAMDFIAESVRHGAFSGPAWNAWRMRSSGNPGLMSAFEYLKYTPVADEIPLLAPGTDQPADVANIMAGLIESFAVQQAGIQQTQKIGSPQTISQEVVLGELQRLILITLLHLGAVNSDSRQTTPEIAVKAEGKTAEPDRFKRPLADLARKGLVSSKEGRGGGFWLTPSGILRADQIDKL